MAQVMPVTSPSEDSILQQAPSARCQAYMLTLNAMET